MLTVGGHANSLLQEMSGEGSPQIHMMTAVIVNQTTKLRTIMRMYSAQTMKISVNEFQQKLVLM